MRCEMGIGVFLILFVLLTVSYEYSLGLLLRALGRIPFYYTFNDANTFSVGVTEQFTDSEGEERKGNVIKAFHAVPGHFLDKSSYNEMEWMFREGVEPEHESYTYEKFGVQSMESVFVKLLKVTDRRFRFTQEKDAKGNTIPGEPKTVFKEKKTRHIDFSGEMTVVVTGADTKDKLALNFEIDFAFNRIYPVRSVLRLANAESFMTSIVREMVNLQTVSRDAEAYYGGEGVLKNRQELAELLTTQDFKDKLMKEVGIFITTVIIRDVDMSQKHKDLLEAKTNAAKAGQARIEAANQEQEERRIKAETGLMEARKRADGIRAEGDAEIYVMNKRINEVILLAAVSSDAAANFQADVRGRSLQYVPGLQTLVEGGATPVVPVGKQ